MNILRPSSSGKWTRCSASARFEDAVPDEPESEAAREGTAAAWVVETSLQQSTPAVEMVGATHDNGWLVTRDMTDHAQGFLSMAYARGGTLYGEHEVKLNDHIKGRLDLAATVDSQGVLFVDDYKFGYQIVEPVENTQLLIYAGALMRGLSEDEHNRIKRIQLGIYQPRAFHPDGIYRTWEITPERLDFYIKWIEKRGDDALDPNSEASPGDWCKNLYCKAASSCTALAHSIYLQHELVSDPRQRTMTSVELAEELTFLTLHESLVKARKSAVYAEAESRIKTKAEFVPGWNLKPQFGNRKFTVSAATVEMLTGVKATKAVTKTPAEMERDGAPVDVIKSICETPQIGHKLKPLTQREIDARFKKD